MPEGHKPITLRVVILFFLPLIFMMELHQLCHTAVHAVLARLGDPLPALAAYSIAYSFNTIFSCTVTPSTQAGISFISDRSSFWRLFRFFCLMALFPFAVIELTALTPLGSIIFGGWMGASAEVIQQARTASAVMAFWIYPILIRNFAYALALINRRTILITYATVVRLVALVFFLLILPFWFEGAVVGGAALVACMAVEAIYMIVLATPFFRKLPLHGENEPGYKEMWRFSWPLVVAQSSENGVAFIVNLFLGRLANPDLAIAAYGVANALMKVILSPFKNLIQTVQTLMRSREDMIVLLKFSAGLQLFFVGVVWALFYTPINVLVLKNMMGLTAELREYIIPGVRLIFLVAIFWGCSSVCRGMLAAIRSTYAIAATAGIRLLVIAGVGSVTFFMPNLNGAVMGVLAVSAAFLVESIVLGWRLYIKFQQPGFQFSPVNI